MGKHLILKCPYYILVIYIYDAIASINGFIQFLFFFLGNPNEVMKKYAAYNQETRQYECTICQKTALQKANLIKHIESVHFPNYFVYNCNYCDKTFPNRNNMYTHISTFHKNKKC